MDRDTPTDDLDRLIDALHRLREMPYAIVVSRMLFRRLQSRKRIPQPDPPDGSAVPESINGIPLHPFPGVPKTECVLFADAKMFHEYEELRQNGFEHREALIIVFLAHNEFEPLTVANPPNPLDSDERSGVDLPGLDPPDFIFQDPLF